uniref:Uncharacterized protein n=1 Tax=Anguilla anguilla TaxID=7936 RepID=A0A0E9U554_ANGAN
MNPIVFVINWGLDISTIRSD